MGFFEDYTIGTSTVILWAVVIIFVIIVIITYYSYTINNTVNTTGEELRDAAENVVEISDKLKPYFEGTGDTIKFLVDHSTEFGIVYCATLDSYCYTMGEACKNDTASGIFRPNYCETYLPIDATGPTGIQYWVGYCECINCLLCDSGCPGSCEKCTNVPDFCKSGGSFDSGEQLKGKSIDSLISQWRKNMDDSFTSLNVNEAEIYDESSVVTYITDRSPVNNYSIPNINKREEDKSFSEEQIVRVTNILREPTIN
jgi:hypothetical protein